MTFLQVIKNAIDKSKEWDNIAYVGQGKAGLIVSTEYRKDWLFKAYPGGRKIFSVRGKELAIEEGLINPSPTE